MIKKAIFGGTFDPIHNGHLHIAYEALYKFNLNKIIFMPSGNPPHKLGKKITNASFRYEMVKAVTREEKSFDISSYEINKINLSYTYQTLQHFNDLEKDTEWHFLTGADCLMDIESWKNADKIFQLCKMVVFNRPGYNIENIEEQKSKVEKKYNGEIIFLDIPLLDISSTNIRNTVREGKNVSYLLPESVYNIIKQLNLYKY
ncbi:nicotinate-nucleotide adenylyltransferase [Clostridium magnum]|uniref:Probable nicotinate-nucleotide adenylyltransferase n=1 Tax=Clostridium magnum DSM 2767 TaxID=1121326 RepID=A0A162UFZ0_9CLOT|nr:nicotinate-nucleotide adenylyltransferase [Clostridium magnum]KZL93860.1 putative nicotinate-nucleotide adenylyltransferase [Clostridium magnum DSM 2767]SHH97353.1 nicotinate-nucleotide adenylyltransferase [Clostridium magnum DSM 2767]